MADSSSLTRRTLLGVGAGLAGLVAADPALAAPKRRRRIRRSDFAGTVGRTYVVRGGGRRRRLRLKGIDDIVPSGPQHREWCFSLSFDPGRKPLADGVYVVTRRGVPTHRLFLSGYGTRGRVQAIVNGKR